MLYLAEAPLHFGLVITSCILTLLFVFFGLILILKTSGGSRITSFFGFLSVLFAFLTFLVLTLSMYLLPALATIDLLLPYYQWAWSFVGVHAFFLVYYLDWRRFKERLWINILPILGTLSFLVLVWILPTPVTAFVVSDGVLNYVAMPLTLIAYGGFLAILYMFLFPLYNVYQLAKQREGAAALWTWVILLGDFMWFIAIVLFALVQYIVAYMLYVFGLAALSWFITLFAMILFQRASKPAT